MDGPITITVTSDLNLILRQLGSTFKGTNP